LRRLYAAASAEAVRSLKRVDRLRSEREARRHELGIDEAAADALTQSALNPAIEVVHATQLARLQIEERTSPYLQGAAAALSVRSIAPTVNVAPSMPTIGEDKAADAEGSA